MAKKKKKKVVKYKPARTKTKLVPSKIPGVDFDVIGKSKPAKKVVKTTVKKPRARKAGTLPPMIVPLPRKPKRTIPKDVTKRAPRAVPKRKSAVERERRVQFAKEHPLMQRRRTPPPVPSRLRGRPAPTFDASMLLAPLGAGPAISAAAKAAKKLGKRATTGLGGLKPRNRKKPRKKVY
jgi:hypothetical protein